MRVSQISLQTEKPARLEDGENMTESDPSVARMGLLLAKDARTKTRDASQASVRRFGTEVSGGTTSPWATPVRLSCRCVSEPPVP